MFGKTTTVNLLELLEAAMRTATLISWLVVEPLVMEIWFEEFRPKSLDEVILPPGVKKLLKRMVQTRTLQHLLFYGPPGTGKTSTALAIARELYGDQWRRYTLELNASDDRGIDVIRSKVKTFAQAKPVHVPFKLIILDEADAMTTDAQQALRRLIEKYSNVTRFILIANYPSKIIEPIRASRLLPIRFGKLPMEEAVKLMKKILEAKGYRYEEEALKYAYQARNGDMRAAINLLQSAAMIVGSGGKITLELIRNISMTGFEEVQHLLALTSENFNEALRMLRYIMYTKGLASMDIIKSMHKYVLGQRELNPDVKVELLELLGEASRSIAVGTDDEIVLTWLIAELHNLFKKYKVRIPRPQKK